MNRTLRTLLGGAALAATLVAAPASAQVGPLVDDPWGIARELYADERYDEAIPYVIEAIQREPTRAEFYLGLARMLFWLEQWDRAVFYYDLYLDELVPYLPADTPRRNQPELVREERDTANGNRTDAGVPVAAPQAEERAYALLRERLSTGTIVAVGGGGAWATFEGLLRSGYARPHLVELREDLAAALLDEAELFVNGRAAAMPALSWEQWETQCTRFDIYEELTASIERSRAEATPQAQRDTPAPTPADPSADTGAEVAPEPTAAPGDRAVTHLDAQRALCTGQMDFLNMNYRRAAESFDAAITADPWLLPAYLGALNARLVGDVALDGVPALLDGLTESAQAVGVDPSDVLALYRISALAEAEDYDQAADLLRQVLSGE